MRYIFDTNGNDVTSNVVAAISTYTVLPVADLFWFEYIDPSNASNGPNIRVTDKFMTSAPWPIAVNKLQNQPGPTGIATINATYQPARIQREALNYEIGFGDQSVDITWFVDDSVDFGSLAWGFKWALIQGYLDEAPVWIHRAYFTPGIYPSTPNAYPSLLGTTLVWRGFVRDVKADRGQVVITLASLMHLFQGTQIPTQTIQPGNRVPPFFPGSVSLFGNSITGIKPLSTSTPTDLQFTLSAGSYADHSLRDAYFTLHQQPPPNGWIPHSGQPGPGVFRIRDNVTNNSPVASTLHVFPYEPINPVNLICTPNNTNQFMEIFFPQPLNSGGQNGFPYVPPPEVSF